MNKKGKIHEPTLKIPLPPPRKPHPFCPKILIYHRKNLKAPVLCPPFFDLQHLRRGFSKRPSSHPLLASGF